MLINERVVCSLMTGIMFDVVLVVLILVLRLCPFIKNNFNLQFLLKLFPRKYMFQTNIKNHH